MENIFDISELFGRNIKNRNMRPHTIGDFCRIQADNAGSDDYNLGRHNPCDPAQHRSAAIIAGLQVLSTDLDGNFTRNLAHRPQQRQRTVSSLDSFIGNCRDFLFNQYIQKLRLNRKVKIRNNCLSRFKKLKFFGQRFLDFYDNFGFCINIARIIKNFCADFLIQFVIKPYCAAGITLNVDRMAVINQGFYRRGDKRDSFFTVFNLFWDTNNHKTSGF